jgi:hypothetical protein
MKLLVPPAPQATETGSTGETHDIAATSRWSRYVESSRFLWLLVACGVGLRLVQYLSNRSLYVDEAAVLLNLRNRSALELIGSPLDFAQTSPLGFLLLQKIGVSLAGEHEFVFRFVPLLAGVVSVPLFMLLARRVLSGMAVPVVVALFSFSLPLIYFSADGKPYAVDVLATLVILLSVLWWSQAAADHRRVICLALAGAVLVWLSQPAMLVLGGIGAVCLWLYVREPGAVPLPALAVVLTSWVISGLASLALSIHTLSEGQSQYMRAFWESGFFPVVPQSAADVLWLPLAFVRISIDPLGALHPGLMVPALVFGIVGIRHLPRPYSMLVAAPILVTLLASAARQYPMGGLVSDFAGRVILFLVPVLLLIVGAGVARIGAIFPIWFSRAFVALLLLLNIAPALLRIPYQRNEIRPVLEYVSRHQQPGDVVYVYYGARHVFDFYAPRFPLEAATTVYGSCNRGEPARYLDEMDGLRGAPRLWFVITHPVGMEARLLVEFLDLNGRRLDRIDTTNASATLYDLSLAEHRRIPADPALYAVTRHSEQLRCAGLWEWPVGK